MRIYLLTQNATSPWVTAVLKATPPLGEITIGNDQEFRQRLAAAPPDLLLLDASGFTQDVVKMVEQCRRLQPEMPIIVATTSPTWKNARAVLMAGATDYIRHSFDVEEIRQICQKAVKPGSGIF